MRSSQVRTKKFNEGTRGLLAKSATALVVMGLAAGCASSAPSEESGGGGDVVMGSASQGSDTYVTAVSMSDLVAQNTEIATTVQSVGGAVPIIRAIDEGTVDLGIPQSAAVYSAFNGEAPFEEPVEIRTMLRGFQVPWQLIVTESSGIEELSDLEGKRLAGERPALPEVRAVTDAMLAAGNVDAGSVNIISTNETNEVLDALQQGTLDAAILPGTVGASNLSQLAFNANVEWIDLSAHTDSMLDSLNVAFDTETIPAGTYEGQEQDVTTVATSQVVIAGEEVPEETVYNITKTLIENNDKIQGAAPESWTVENTLGTDPAAPFHPGAIQYFEEIGAWSEELQQAQDELLGGTE